MRLASLDAVFKVPCGYCILSATCSYLAAYFGLRWLDESEEGGVGGVGAVEAPRPSGHIIRSWRSASALAGLCAALVVSQAPPYALAGPEAGAPTALSSESTAQPGQVLYSPPPVTSKTDGRSLALLKRLRNQDARLYGAYWCSHCFDQKSSLGDKFYDYVTYRECASDGVGYTKDGCLVKGKKLKGYPTWVIGGWKVEGERDLEELEGILDRVEKGLAPEED